MKSDPTAAVIFVVDSDDVIRGFLRRLLASAGFTDELFAPGVEFLARAKPDRNGCQCSMSACRT